MGTPHEALAAVDQPVGKLKMLVGQDEQQLQGFNATTVDAATGNL